MSKKIFGLEDIRHTHTFQGTPSKKKRYSFPTANSSGLFTSSSQSNSLVDPIWETIDPTPDLHALFQQYDDSFFGGRLAACEVKWSSRMTLCAGICSFESKGRFCSIRLSKPLLQYRPRKDLVETLLHEMIHAFLFLSDGVMDHDGHGPMFQFHMHRINMSAGTNITVYHNFHNEVVYHQKHWWRCTGPCRMRPPFYGWVKRSMNRAPGMNDFWWKEHQMTCGGNFVKVKEPEGYGTKKMSKISNGNSQSQSCYTPLSRYFTGKAGISNQLSSSENILDCNLNVDRSRNNLDSSGMKLKMPAKNYYTGGNSGAQKSASTAKEDAAAIAVPKDNFLEKNIPGSSRSGDVRNIELVGNDVIVCVQCPVCTVHVPENTINSHLDSCLTQNS